MKSGNQEECVLCCREIAIFAVGVCDHPVCYECSSRMRVLCETNECPICRSEIPVVIFTHQNLPFADLSRKSLLINRKYNTYFEDEKVRRSFELLLINKCNDCGEAFPTFDKLKEHVRRKHELYYCDLCSDNLKIFTFERKCYNRHDLARHKRKGDPDLTSHRGHPLCEFCDKRFVDNDELFRHLRREHYFCHFCDADGLHQYYESYDYLKVHFRTDHYLCEEGDCINEKFTAVFRSEIGLKAHKATQHNRNKSKAEARQARTLDLEFNYTPLSRPTGSSSPRGRRLGPARRNNNNEDHNSQGNSKRQQPESEPLNTQSMQDFPYLSEEALSSSNSAAAGSTLSLQSFGKTPAPPYRPKNIMSVEDFPALGPTNVTSFDSFTSQSKKMNITAKPNSAINVQVETFNQKSAHNVKILRDSKPENRPVRKQNASNWISKNEANFEEDFPKLETKKVPSPPEYTKKYSAHTPSALSTTSQSTSEDLRTSEDQFIIIKSKSKKKKQKPVDDNDEEEDSSEQNIPEPFPAFNTYNLNNQENKDPYKPHRPVKQQQIYRESDTWETTVSFRKDDFPPLEVMKKPPPGLHINKPQAPPPGFTTNAPKSSKTLSLSSVASIVGNSVKKSQNFNGLSHSSHSRYEYHKPPNFQSRNEKLIQTIVSLSRTPEKFQEFKLISKNFRCSVISASEYYNKCLELLGDEGFADAFPELVSLLPDIPKQQELLAVHNQLTNTPNVRETLKRKNKLKDFNSLLSCESCNQVLLTRDCRDHECILDII